MPPKQNTNEAPKKTKVEGGAMTCGVMSPGPKYKIKTVVGYKDHCTSKHRNPAYTIGRKQTGDDACKTPGPKYKLLDPKLHGVSMGYAAKTTYESLGPGPKYMIPRPIQGPAYSLQGRTGYRKGDVTPGPYPIKSGLNGPAYTIGFRQTETCAGGPGPYSIKDVTKRRSPAYTIGFKYTDSPPCKSPGPKYDPYPYKSYPKYSFGVLRSPCAPPYILDCDDQC